MEFTEFLVYLFASGGNVAIASFILERSVHFQALEKGKKEIVFYFTAAILGASAWAFATYVPAETIAVISPVFKILYLSFGGIFAGELYHRFDKKESKEEEVAG